MLAKQALDDVTVKQRLAAELPHWELKDGMIRRTYKTPGWPHTLMLVNVIGYLAEAAWHHPDLEVSYAQLTVKLMSHDAKGISERDLALAQRIDGLALWQPDAGSPFEGWENGNKKQWVH